MGLKYNPATGRLLRTNTPKLVDECPDEPGCANTEILLAVSNVTNTNPIECNCLGGFNNLFVLDGGGVGSILTNAGCPEFTTDQFGIVANQDYACSYQVIFSSCGITWAWDVYIIGQFGVGWWVGLGLRSSGSNPASVGNYNFSGGNVANVCFVWEEMKQDAGVNGGTLLAFQHTFQEAFAPFTCASCGDQYCFWDNITINFSVQLQ